MPLTPEEREALRRLYSGDPGTDIRDPHFAAIADLIVREGGFRPPPYAGHPTLLDAPARVTGDDGAPVLSDLHVALFGVPMDLGVTNRNGARFGPRAVRAVERVGPYNEALRCAPVQELRVADIGDVPMASRFDLATCHHDIETFAHTVVKAGVLPLAVGGDHSVSLPLLRAVGAERPVGMVHIDAHCDTGGIYEGEKFHHGGPFRHAVLEGVLDPTRTIQIGIRGSAEFLWEFSTASGMTVIPARALDETTWDDVNARIRAVVGDGPVYVSFDIDSIDPAFAPGTGTPEVGGLTPREALLVLRSLKGLQIVGGDMVEVAPAYDATSNTAHVGAQMLFEILSLMRFSPALGLPDAAAGEG
ncbi:MAG: agmatinase [Pseudomonadota bacterium]